MSRQVKVCPKCGNENRSDGASCSNCYAALSSVPVTLSTKPEPAAVAAPRPVTPRATAPSSGPTPTPSAPRETPPAGPVGGFPGGPIGGYTPPPRPVAKGSNPVGLISVILLIAAVAFAGWWFFMKPLPPDQVVQRFTDAMNAKDVATAVKYLSQADIDQAGGEDNAKSRLEMMTRNDSGSTATTGEVTYEGENTALVELIETGSSADQMRSVMGPDYKSKAVVVREDGKWKVSFSQTVQRAMADMIQKMRSKSGGRGFGMPSTPRIRR